MWPGFSERMKKNRKHKKSISDTALRGTEKPQGSDKEVGNSDAIPREERKLLSGVLAPGKPLREWQGSHAGNTLSATHDGMRPNECVSYNVFCYLTISYMCMITLSHSLSTLAEPLLLSNKSHSFQYNVIHYACLELHGYEWFSICKVPLGISLKKISLFSLETINCH